MGAFRFEVKGLVPQLKLSLQGMITTAALDIEEKLNLSPGLHNMEINAWSWDSQQKSVKKKTFVREKKVKGQCFIAPEIITNPFTFKNASVLIVMICVARLYWDMYRNGPWREE